RPAVRAGLGGAAVQLRQRGQAPVGEPLRPRHRQRVRERSGAAGGPHRGDVRRHGRRRHGRRPGPGREPAVVLHPQGRARLTARKGRSGTPAGPAGRLAYVSADSDLTRGAAGIARGAALIAGLTVLSRLLGLARTLVFSQRIGASCLGTAYVTANQIPNLIYELLLGGALTSAMVPVLARSAERAGSDPEERARVSQITSALLTWS